MSPANWSLLIGALVACILAWRTPRGLLWVALAAIDYAASVIYWRAGFPYPEGFVCLCDAVVCLSLYFMAKERWELGIYRLFQISVAVNILFLAGSLGIFYRIDVETYSILEELLNWLTLLSIGGIGAAEWIGAPIVPARHPVGRFHRVILALRAPRAPHFLARKT